jgi:hypothetical protein
MDVLDLSPWVWSTQGLLYNVPALTALTWMLWKRPLLGAVLTALVYGRVVAHVIPWSMHACLATTMVAVGWRSGVAGFLLWAWTAYFYVVVLGDEIAPVLLGTLAGGGLLMVEDLRKVLSKMLHGRGGR